MAAELEGECIYPCICAFRGAQGLNFIPDFARRPFFLERPAGCWVSLGYCRRVPASADSGTEESWIGSAGGGWVPAGQEVTQECR